MFPIFPMFVMTSDRQTAQRGVRTDTGDMEPPGVTMASCSDTGRILGAYNQPVTPAGARETLDSQIIPE